jgi:hypothetical protein
MWPHLRCLCFRGLERQASIETGRGQCCMVGSPATDFRRSVASDYVVPNTLVLCHDHVGRQAGMTVLPQCYVGQGNGRRCGTWWMSRLSNALVQDDGSGSYWSFAVIKHDLSE